MQKGTFYAVGIGPGDPELITLKAVRVMADCPVIAAVRTRSGASLAYDIAAQAVDLTEKTVLPLSFPMPRDAAERERHHIRAAQAVVAQLECGRDVAMPNLGDVAIYSTASYILSLVTEAGYTAEMIPGVPSFCAAAARLKTSLTTMEKPLHIIPACHDGLNTALDWS
jgi:precorrin-2/cobalt-factor-2 C20-methyltransferase